MRFPWCVDLRSPAQNRVHVSTDADQCCPVWLRPALDADAEPGIAATNEEAVTGFSSWFVGGDPDLGRGKVPRSLLDLCVGTAVKTFLTQVADGSCRQGERGGVGKIWSVFYYGVVRKGESGVALRGYFCVGSWLGGLGQARGRR